jgi:hypothetical protein
VERVLEDAKEKLYLATAQARLMAIAPNVNAWRELEIVFFDKLEILLCNRFMGNIIKRTEDGENLTDPEKPILQTMYTKDDRRG